MVTRVNIQELNAAVDVAIIALDSTYDVAGGIPLPVGHINPETEAISGSRVDNYGAALIRLFEACEERSKVGKVQGENPYVIADVAEPRVRALKSQGILKILGPDMKYFQTETPRDREFHERLYRSVQEERMRRAIDEIFD